MATITFNGQIRQGMNMYFSLCIQDLQQIILLFNFGYNLKYCTLLTGLLALSRDDSTT